MRVTISRIDIFPLKLLEGNAMFNDLGSAKRELSELAPILNTFKSEAVQLRILEHLIDSLGVQSYAEPSKISNSNGSPKKRHQKNHSTHKNDEPRPHSSKSSKNVRKGPGSFLAELIDEGFFKKPKTIGDVILECKNKKAKTFKMEQMSTPLARATRNTKLARTQNKEGQYEYTNV